MREARQHGSGVSRGPKAADDWEASMADDVEAKWR
jgi:hypothetical protein